MKTKIPTARRKAAEFILKNPLSAANFLRKKQEGKVKLPEIPFINNTQKEKIKIKWEYIRRSCLYVEFYCFLLEKYTIPEWYWIEGASVILYRKYTKNHVELLKHLSGIYFKSGVLFLFPIDPRKNFDKFTPQDFANFIQNTAWVDEEKATGRKGICSITVNLKAPIAEIMKRVYSIIQSKKKFLPTRRFRKKDHQSDISLYDRFISPQFDLDDFIGILASNSQDRSDAHKTVKRRLLRIVEKIHSDMGGQLTF